ncbi:MAG: hypothetical protein IPO39_03720 [Bacteroidetes bacterium]|nr:hypothetical protein [Bacteroidota bacterium]
MAKEFRSASTGYQYLQFIYATTDGFGNIYIIGVVNEDSFCIIKIDLYGNQLFSKLWKYPSPSLGTLHFPNYISNINQMHYKDGNLYCYARNGALNESAILVFDTAFSISCYLPDTIYADSIFNSIPTQRTFTQFPTSSVVLTSDSLPMGTAIVPNVIYPCTQVQISEFPSLDQSLIVWPNPVFNEMHLKFTSGNDEMQQHFRFMLLIQWEQLFLKMRLHLTKNLLTWMPFQQDCISSSTSTNMSIDLNQFLNFRIDM